MIRTLTRAAALLALCAPLAAAAQEGPLPRKPSRPAPPPPSTAAPSASADPEGALRLGGLLGLEFASGDTGLALRVDGEMKVAELSPRVGASGLVSLGFTRFGDKSRDLDVTTNLVKVVPGVRLTLPNLAPQLGVHADAGVGFYYASSSIKVRGLGVGGDRSDSAVGLALRIAGAGFYDLSDRLRLGAELGLNPYLGDFDETSVSLLGLLTYRL